MKAIVWFFRTWLTSLFDFGAKPSPVSHRFSPPNFRGPRNLTLEQRVIRGHAVASLLENQAVKDTFEDITAEIYRKWLTAGSVDAREECHRCIQLVERMKSDLLSIVTTGKAAEIESAAQQTVRRVA